MNEYSILRLERANIKHLYELQNAVYGRKRQANYFELKYDTKYTGAEYIGYLAFNKANCPIAFYGLVPTFTSINKSKVLAAQSCDTMTHPDYRNKGLFVDLALKTFELAEKAGIHFVFGFPNQNSLRGFINKLGFSHAHTLERYTFEFEDSMYKKLLRKYSRKIKTERTTKFSNALLNAGFDGVIYNEAFIGYKSYDSNGFFVTNSYSAWLNFSGAIWLGAISSLTENNVDDLINAIKNKFNSQNMTYMISPGIDVPGSFKDLKKEEGFALITKNLSMVHDLSQLKFQFADIDIF